MFSDRGHCSAASNSGITAALKVSKPRLWSVLYMYLHCIHKYIYKTLVQRPFGKDSSQGQENPRGSEAKRTLYFCINISLYLHVEVWLKSLERKKKVERSVNSYVLQVEKQNTDECLNFMELPRKFLCFCWSASLDKTNACSSTYGLGSSWIGVSGYLRT